MSTENVPARASNLPRQRAALAFFALALALGAWRLWRLRYQVSFDDESNGLATGWAMHFGRRLYDTLFSNHAPLETLLAQGVVGLGLGRDLVAARMLVWSLHALAALALARSALFDKRASLGWVAGGLYGLLYAIVSPAIFGHLFSVYSISGALWVTAFALLLGPAAAGRQVPPAHAMLGGAALAFWASGSPTTLIPLAALLLMLAVAGQPRRQWAWGLLGAAVVAVAWGAWFWRFASWRGFYEQVVLFNLQVYPAYSGEPGGQGMLARVFRDYGQLWAGASRADLALLLGLPLALWLLPAERSARRSLALALAWLGVLLLRTRGPHWRSLEFECAHYAGLAMAAPLLWARFDGKRARWALALLALVALQALHEKGYKQVPYAGGRDDWAGGPNKAIKARLDQVAAAVPQGESVLFLPIAGNYYLYCPRPPGHAGVYYYPWQAVWEFKAPGRADNLCT